MSFIIPQQNKFSITPSTLLWLHNYPRNVAYHDNQDGTGQWLDNYGNQGRYDLNNMQVTQIVGHTQEVQQRANQERLAKYMAYRRTEDLIKLENQTY